MNGSLRSVPPSGLGGDVRGGDELNSRSIIWFPAKLRPPLDVKSQGRDYSVASSLSWPRGRVLGNNPAPLPLLPSQLKIVSLIESLRTGPIFKQPVSQLRRGVPYMLARSRTALMILFMASLVAAPRIVTAWSARQTPPASLCDPITTGSTHYVPPC